MYKNAIKMLGRAIFERFYQIFGVFISKNMVFSGFQSGVFFGVLRFPFGVFGPKLSGHTAILCLILAMILSRMKHFKICRIRKPWKFFFHLCFVLSSPLYKCPCLSSHFLGENISYMNINFSSLKNFQNDARENQDI